MGKARQLLLLGMLLALILTLAIPATVLALPTNIDGCTLDIGVTCTKWLDFNITSIKGVPFYDPYRKNAQGVQILTADEIALFGKTLARVKNEIEALAQGSAPITGDPLTGGKEPYSDQSLYVEFDYRHTIFPVTQTGLLPSGNPVPDLLITFFGVTLNLPVDPQGWIASGSIEDGDLGSSGTIRPYSAGILPTPPIPTSVGNFSASFQYMSPGEGAIDPATSVSSDVLFYRTIFPPATVFGAVAGDQVWTNLAAAMMMTGSGNSDLTIVAYPQTELPVPEPLTIILLGGGLLGLTATKRFRSRKKITK